MTCTRISRRGTRSTRGSSPPSPPEREGSAERGAVLVLGADDLLDGGVLLVGLHRVLVAVALLGRGRVIAAAGDVVVDAVAVGVAGVGALGGDAVRLEGVVDAHARGALGHGAPPGVGAAQRSASMIAVVKASRSSGVREVMRRTPAVSSTTTSWSVHSPPALTRSVRMVAAEVRVRPFASPVSTRSQGAWQIAATGFPAAATERTRNWAVSSARRVSAFRVPPGSTRASTSLALTVS